MAISIHQTPPLYAPGFNDLIYVVSSNNTAQANFQYVCDIYVTDDAGAVSHAGQSYLRKKTPADPVYSSGVFNITQEVRAFLTSDIGDAAYNFQKSNNSIIRIICQFGEEYGPSSGVTVYPDLTNDVARTYWNAGLDFQDSINYNVDEWVGNTASTTRNSLTYRPTSGTIRSDEREWVSNLAQSVNEIKYAMVEVWKANGTFVRLFQINNIYSGIASAGERFVRIPVGMGQLDQIPPASILSGNQPISFNAGRYRVYFTNATSGTVREEQWYVIDDDACTQHDRYRLHFRNKAGGYDSFTFSLAHKHSMDIKRDTFKRNMITRIGGGRYGTNMSDKGDVNYRTQIKDKITLNSDWINETESEWLEQLVTSPEVYHDHPTDGLIAISITNSEYTRKQQVTDGLFNLELTFQYSYDRYRQDL